MSTYRCTSAYRLLLFLIMVLPGKLLAQASPELLLDINPGPNGSRMLHQGPWAFSYFENYLLFDAYYEPGFQFELYKTKGVPGDAESLTALDGQVTFSGVSLNGELVYPTNHPDRTVKATDVDTGQTEIIGDYIGGPGPLFKFDDQYIYYLCRDETQGWTLCLSDGTLSSTIALDLPWSGSSPGEPFSFVKFQDEFYYIAFNANEEYWLWKTHPSSEDIVPITKVGDQDLMFSNWDRPIVYGDIFLFAGHDEENGTELWRSDGTAAGTFRLSDINPGTFASRPDEGHLLGDKVVFFATDGNFDNQLFSIDQSENIEQLTSGDQLAGYAHPIKFDEQTMVFFAAPGEPAAGLINIWVTGGNLPDTQNIYTFSDPLSVHFVYPVFKQYGGLILPIDSGGIVKELWYLTPDFSIAEIAKWDTTGGWFMPVNENIFGFVEFDGQGVEPAIFNTNSILNSGFE